MTTFTDKEELKNAIDDYLGTNPNRLPSISVWDVSGIEDMSNLFNGVIINAKNNNKLLGIANWNVSNVKNMHKMFLNCPYFNQPLDSWNVSNVIDMSYMFKGGMLFNQPLDSWNVSNVTNMSNMFDRCVKFDQPLDRWNVSNVINMSSMFDRCIKFNKSLNINGSVDQWNVSNVENMSNMFYNCSQFNQPLNNWNVSKVTNMHKMFYSCKRFNQPLDQWNVSNVTNMNEMFSSCLIFNQDLHNWDVSSVINSTDFAKGTPMVPENLPNFNAEREATAVEPPIEPSEEESLRRFPDFEGFMAFFNTHVCPDGGNLLPDNTLSVDHFCQSKSEFASIEYFTTYAPEGFSLLTVPPRIYESSPTPFYTAMKHVNSNIGRYSLPGEVKSYMIVLNRLIYYYTIFLLINESKLSGFENTTGIIIYTHGVYKSYNERDILPVERPIENMFICTKATPGCLTYDYGEIVYSDMAYPNSSLHVMTDNIERNHFVNFDQTVFRYEVPDMLIYDTKRKDAIKDPRMIANPHINSLTPPFGIEMRHYISPITNSYFNKSFEGNTFDHKCYVFDLELLHNHYKHTGFSKNVLRYNISAMFNRPYNILSLPQFQSRKISTRNGDLIHFTMKDIMDYCKAKGKPNVFIYDKSCGGITGVNLDDVKGITTKGNAMSILGWGIWGSLTQHKNKNKTAKRKRKTNKKSKRKSTKKTRRRNK